MLKSLSSLVIGSVVTALLVFFGPATYNKVAKMFEPLPLSPLAKVVLEKLESSPWTIQQEGISCDILWIRGETDARNPKALNAEDLKTCGVYIRNASVNKELLVNDQFQAHEMKVILPKAKAMYEKLLSEKNADTAFRLQSDAESKDPAPRKKVAQPQFSTCGKLIYDSLGSSKDSVWKLYDNKKLVSKTNKLLYIDTSVASTDCITMDSCQLPTLNSEEKNLILERAKELREALLQQVLQDVLVSQKTQVQPMPTVDARVAAELKAK